MKARIISASRPSTDSARVLTSATCSSVASDLDERPAGITSLRRSRTGLSVGPTGGEVLPHRVEESLVAGVLGFPLSDYRLQRLVPLGGLLLGRNSDEALRIFLPLGDQLVVA